MNDFAVSLVIFRIVFIFSVFFTKLLTMLRFPTSSSLLKFTSYFFLLTEQKSLWCYTKNSWSVPFAVLFLQQNVCYLDKGANSHSDLETTHKKLYLANSQALQNWGQGKTFIDRWQQWFPSTPTGSLCYNVLSTELDLTAIPWHYFQTPSHLLFLVTEDSLSPPARGNTKDRIIFWLFAGNAWFQIYRLPYSSVS